MLLILITLISVYFTPSQLLEESTFKVNSNYNRPVIGILTLPDDDAGNRTSPSNFPASYVKFIESAGARVLPVFIGRDEDYYKSIMNITNGMLFTGGSTNLRDSIYTSTASIIWSYALQLNQAGDYYPLWGTCQGFELFLYLVNDQQWPLVSCSAINLAGKVTFLLDDKQLKETKLFKNAPNSIIKALAKDPVTFNWHDWCLPVGYMHLPKLQDFFTAMSKSVDYKGLEFISMIEAKDFPFYGVQFHPEKPPYEPVINPRYTNTPQTLEAILVSQYFSNFFISETRKSHHIYPETEYYRSQLIYNYCPQYTGINASASNVETYYFY